MDRVLVDTSVWIEFFRKKDPWHAAVSGLMDERRIVCAGIILAELIQGSKSESERQVIRDFRQVFPFIEESVDLWQAAGELSGALLRKGRSVGLSDSYLAAAAKENSLVIFTLDKHFELLKASAGITLYSFR